MTEKNQKPFSERLWEFRKQNQLTQVAAAEYLRIKKKTFESWEHGRYEPREPMLTFMLERIDQYKPDDEEDSD